MINISVTRIERIPLTPSEAEEVFRAYLSHIVDNRWVRDGKLIEEVTTSHRYDHDCEDQRDLELVQTIDHLLDMLKQRSERVGTWDPKAYKPK